MSFQWDVANGRGDPGERWEGRGREKSGYCSPPLLCVVCQAMALFPLWFQPCPPMGPPAVVPSPIRKPLEPGLETSSHPSTPLSQGVVVPSSCN